MFHPADKSHSPERLDICGIMLNTAVLSFATYTVLSTPTLIYMEMDPLFLFQKYVYLLTDLKFPLILANTLQIILGCQVCRLLCMSTCLLTVWTRLLIQCVQFLSNESNRLATRNIFALQKYFSQHDGTTIILAMASKPMGHTVSMSMWLIFMACIIFNFTTIKLYSVIPTEIYFIALSASIMTPVVTKTMLPLVLDIYENGKSLRDKWNYVLSMSQNKKYLKRKLKSIKIICLYGELFGVKLYKCQKSIKLGFYSATLIYTVNALLSIRL